MFHDLTPTEGNREGEAAREDNQANSSKIAVILKSSVKVVLLHTSAESSEVTQKRKTISSSAETGK